MKSMSIKDKITWCIATVFGVGYAPLCPGTAGSVIAVFVFLALKDSSAFLIFTLISVILSFYFCGKAEKLFKQKDCKKIVVDDFSGQLITYLFLPFSLKFIVSGFFLFRMFDMLKIPPANRMEKFHGSLGVVGDDVVAGIWANLILQIVRVVL